MLSSATLPRCAYNYKYRRVDAYVCLRCVCVCACVCVYISRWRVREPLLLALLSAMRSITRGFDVSLIEYLFVVYSRSIFYIHLFVACFLTSWACRILDIYLFHTSMIFICFIREHFALSMLVYVFVSHCRPSFDICLFWCVLPGRSEGELDDGRQVSPRHGHVHGWTWLWQWRQCWLDLY
jgi:hypothetical protein